VNHFRICTPDSTTKWFIIFSNNQIKCEIKCNLIWLFENIMNHFVVESGVQILKWFAKFLYRFLRACSQIYFTTLWFVMVKKLFCFGVYDKSKCLSKLGYKTPQRILTALKSRNANFTFFGSWFIFHSFSVTNLLISPASIFQVCFRISTMAHTVIFKLYM
jgi:hypothetical protein